MSMWPTEFAIPKYLLKRMANEDQVVFVSRIRNFVKILPSGDHSWEAKDPELDWKWRWDEMIVRFIDYNLCHYHDIRFVLN